MKYILCRRDGFKCDLDTKRKSCRHLNGTWGGQCFDRFEHKGTMTELVSVHKIHDPDKDDTDEESAYNSKKGDNI